jgi:hypothetical protein
MAKNGYTQEELAEQIRRGGSVLHEGNLIRTLPELQRIFETPESIDAQLEDLERRKAELKAKRTTASAGDKPSATAATELPNGFTARDLLIAADFNTLEKVEAATDKELDDIPNIGEATVKIIREESKSHREFLKK